MCPVESSKKVFKVTGNNFFILTVTIIINITVFIIDGRGHLANSCAKLVNWAL